MTVKTASAKILKSPYPYPGGKSRIADQVWERFGNVDNYVEPFMGSLAVMLRRPSTHFAGGYRVETCGDVNHFVVNFWRAVAAAPGDVARWADSPVIEADLHARHKWLMRSQESVEWRRLMATDATHYDAKIAGWWVWGVCCWIGGGWCNEVMTGDRTDTSHVIQIPELDHSRGVLAAPTAAHGPRPQLADAFDIGRGVHASGNLSAQVPRMGARFGQMDAPGVLNPKHGTCDGRRAWLADWMQRLSDRLRLVRTCYGHWARVCDSESTMTRLGTTGVFLDPPYPTERGDTGKKSRDDTLYASDKGADLNALRDEVLGWCRRWGGVKGVRAAVCGYEGDGYAALLADGWTETAWEASGGYGNQAKSLKGKGKNDNAKRERIWWSPACDMPLTGPSLFDSAGDM